MKIRITVATALLYMCLTVIEMSKSLDFWFYFMYDCWVWSLLQETNPIFCDVTLLSLQIKRIRLLFNPEHRKFLENVDACFQTTWHHTIYGKTINNLQGLALRIWNLTHKTCLLIFMNISALCRVPFYFHSGCSMIDPNLFLTTIFCGL
jgi:hypothetical protein